MFPTPYLSLTLISMSEEILFLVKEFQSPSCFPFHMLYPVTLFQNLGKALPGMEGGSWIHPTKSLANNIANGFGRS
jgi:hypothetical protein